MNSLREGSVLLYDGLCGFCDGTVQFLLSHDRKGLLRFAPLQGVYAESVMARYPDFRTIDSIILVQPLTAGERELVTVRSEVALQLARYLGGGWTLFSIFRLVPRPLRDWGYDVFARTRYRFFGRRTECRLPTPEERQRFLA